MTRHIRISIALILSIFLFHAVQAQKSSKPAKIDGWKTYKDKSFTLQYPPDWIIRGGEEGIVITILKPITEEAIASGFASINVVKEDLSGGTYTLEEYIRLNIDNLKRVYEGIEVKERPVYKMGKHRFAEIYYSITHEDISLRLTQRIFITQDYGWIVTYGGMVDADSDYYLKFIKEGLRMMETFRLK